MAGWVPIFRSMLKSSIWDATPATRCVWMALMFMADKNGHVEAAIPGLAREANVSLEECESALGYFLSPDRYSKTKDADGRRIEEIEGGWLVINYRKYRQKLMEMKDAEANRVRVERHRIKTQSPPVPPSEKEEDQEQDTIHKRANGCVTPGNGIVMGDRFGDSFEFECPDLVEFTEKNGKRAKLCAQPIAELWELFRNARRLKHVKYCNDAAVCDDFDAWMLTYHKNHKDDATKPARRNGGQFDGPPAEPRVDQNALNMLANLSRPRQ